MSNLRRGSYTHQPSSRNGNNNIYKYIDSKFEQLYNKINSEKYTQFVPSQPGTKGESGSRIFIESNDPTQLIGSNGDVFINNLNWYLYKKIGGNWIYMGTFKGADGLKGENGRHGLRGLKGDKGDLNDKGDRGDKGEKGDKGDKGDLGDKGDKGEQGDQGQVGEQGIKGDSNLIFTFEYTTPGNFSVTVPEGAVNAVVTMTGGGGAGGTGQYGAIRGGGGAGTIYQYPVSVTAFQEITGTLGAGGVSAPNNPGNGGNSTLTIGPNQFISFGGKGGSNDSAFGGTGETVSFPIASQFFPLPAAGGRVGENGTDGNIGTNAYSGAGGGGDVLPGDIGGNGGMVLGFRGGANGGFNNVDFDHNYYGGSGGGASALANGGNGGSAYDFNNPNGQPGSQGSGGGGGSFYFVEATETTNPGGNGGDGYVSIAFYSS
ncbi:collagen [Acanthamoeba polyphaga mimivirus]|uniref:Collagen n=1 Tax=Acanthamoeba polyphaga mimivirus TaxID=212035 RepID=A0A2L2DK67_MIMIV|nr:collagen [Acanthamoeba polyphaga mimivirus]